MNVVDIMTQTDINVETFLKDKVIKRYPSHDEEKYNKSRTVNYTHLFLMFSISIILCVFGVLVINVIYALMLNITYSALKSFVNRATEIKGRNGKREIVHRIIRCRLICTLSTTLDFVYVATGAFDIWWEDIITGIYILRKAKDLITTANPSADIENTVITEVKLGFRLYLAIR
ncbi:inositol monophosphatase [Xylogone sp. PMI_703]|nr:inositol monophosphatase [Xylogone sp. PMI_703]